MRFATAIMFLSVLNLCGCGGDSDVVDCPDAVEAAPTNLSKTAASTVSVSPSGAASYVIQGESMDGVSGMELTIRYDASMFQGTPTVKQESLVSGAMLADNTSLPGVIKIAIISTRPFSGSGPIATITFVSKTAGAPVPVITASMIGSTGYPITTSTGSLSPVAPETAAPGTITTPGVPFSSPSMPPQQPTTPTAARTSCR